MTGRLPIRFGLASTKSGGQSVFTCSAATGPPNPNPNTRAPLRVGLEVKMAGQWRGRFSQLQWRGRFLISEFPRVRAHAYTRVLASALNAAGAATPRHATPRHRYAERTYEQPVRRGGG